MTSTAERQSSEEIKEIREELQETLECRPKIHPVRLEVAEKKACRTERVAGLR